MGTPLVIVESPAKARTIARFLGDSYRVEASVGHIRDLANKKGDLDKKDQKRPGAKYGVDTENGFEPMYVIPKEKRAQVKRLREWVKDASALYLATDEDREGESISWHLLEVLKPEVPVHRLVFHEITDAAIQNALNSPRDLDQNLVRAQEARRIVDRLFGYPMSEVLWVKVGPNLSAGRVQSVAVRLVVQRERLRIAHRSTDWWDVRASFTADGGSFVANLQSWKGTRIATGKDFNDKGQLKNPDKVHSLAEATANAIVEDCADKTLKVTEVEERPMTDTPSPPFTTSTLQQEANRRFKWTARRTMQAAQRLYETGWITYMRTDSTTLSSEALDAARGLISREYGDDYLPEDPRTYKSKAKNAQEAHEAIRPAGSTFRALSEADRELDHDERRLFELVWKRTVASQMTDSKARMVTVRIQSGDAMFEAKGKTVLFDGFRRAYARQLDETEEEQVNDGELPILAVEDALNVTEADARRHSTKPPPRLTEAALVKELEERGIGRPSTYATIIDTILRRDYVFKKGSALVPTWTAFAVTGLLEMDQFKWLVEYDFTARMENQLDTIAAGGGDRQSYLSGFWDELERSMQDAREEIDPREVCTIQIGEVPEASAKELGIDDSTPIVVRVGKYGPFLQCGERTGNIPEDLPPDELSVERALELLLGPQCLGKDEKTGLDVYLDNGRYGWYVQLGENGEKGEKGEKSPPKPKRKSVPRGMGPETVDFERALALLGLPRTVGAHPDSEVPVTVDYGRYGPFVRCGEETRSIRSREGDKVLTIDFAECLELLKKEKGRKRAEVLRELGKDATTDRTVNLMEGRYGPYVTDGSTNASLGKALDPEKVTLEEAIELIRTREKAPKRKARRRKK
jgi:DNA topoisomerase-1